MMKRRLTILLVMLMFSPAVCWAGHKKSDDILRLLTITGALDQAKDIMINLTRSELAAVGENDTEIPAKVLAIIEEETVNILTLQFAEGSPLVEELVNIYSEHYSHDEIHEIIAFYESDVGEKVISTMPQIMEKSMLAGRIMSNSITPLLRENIMLRLKREGFQVPL